MDEKKSYQCSPCIKAWDMTNMALGQFAVVQFAVGTVRRKKNKKKF